MTSRVPSLYVYVYDVFVHDVSVHVFLYDVYVHDVYDVYVHDVYVFVYDVYVHDVYVFVHDVYVHVFVYVHDVHDVYVHFFVYDVYVDVFLSHPARGPSDEHERPVQTHHPDRGAQGPLPGPDPKLHEGHPVGQHQLRGVRVPQDPAGGPVHVTRGPRRPRGLGVVYGDGAKQQHIDIPGLEGRM